MSNKKYFKTVSQKNDNVLVMEFDFDHGGGVLFDLINLTTRELKSGESFESVFEISIHEYEDLVRSYFIKLGDSMARSWENEESLDFVAQYEREEDEKTFEPKTAFTLIHKDIQISGFTERTLPELINFICEVKKNYKHMLIKDVDGEIFAMADARVVHEASFEFESF